MPLLSAFAGVVACAFLGHEAVSDPIEQLGLQEESAGRKLFVRRHA